MELRTSNPPERGTKGRPGADSPMYCPTCKRWTIGHASAAVVGTAYLDCTVCGVDRTARPRAPTWSAGEIAAAIGGFLKASARKQQIDTGTAVELLTSARDYLGALPSTAPVDRYTGLRNAARAAVAINGARGDVRDAIERLRLALLAAPTFTDPTPAPVHYLVLVREDVEAELSGPFASDADRLRAAAVERRDNGDRDGLYWLDVEGSRAKIGDFSGGEIDRAVVRLGDELPASGAIIRRDLVY
jgi:hypothetical protein